jgi:hypothetical protein
VPRAEAGIRPTLSSIPGDRAQHIPAGLSLLCFSVTLQALCLPHRSRYNIEEELVSVKRWCSREMLRTIDLWNYCSGPDDSGAALRC